MTIFDALFSAASGGIVGSGLQLVSSWVKTKNDIALMKATSEAAEKTEAWKAFVAAQNNAGSWSPSPNSWPWVNSLYTLVMCAKEATRPLLTWAAVLLLYHTFNSLTGTPRDDFAKDINFGCWTAIMFWFGSRFTKK